MKVAIGLILTSLLATNAFAQAPQDVTNSTVRFNTNVAKPVPSFALIPVVAIGGASAATLSPNGNSSVTSQDHVDSTSGSNYESGMLAEFGRHTFVFQTGLLYKEHSFKLNESFVSNYTGNTSHINADYSLRYLSIPLMAKARMRVSDGIRLAGRAGVEAAFAMGGKASGRVQTQNGFGQTIQDDSMTTDIKSDDMAAVVAYATVGAGPEFRVAHNQNVRIEGFYERQLTKATKGDSDVKLQAFNAMVSYAFGF